MIKLKNFMLYNEFGEVFSKIASDKNIPPRGKVAISIIYRKLEERLKDIEEARPTAKEGESLSANCVESFNVLLNENLNIDADMVYIDDIIDIVSAKDLILLDPITMES